MSPTTWLRSIVVLRAICFGLIVLGLSGLFAQELRAALFTLSDANSSVEFDTTSQANAYNWKVEGVDQLFQQAFWFRVGNTAESSVHSLPVTFELASNTNNDPGLDTLNVIYGGAGFDIEVAYRLDGGGPGSGASDLTEQIAITNKLPTPLDFHFFQYSDFELLGTAGNDTAVFVNANTVRQTEGALSLSETVATPIPDHREIAFFDSTRDKLEDSVATTLNDLPPLESRWDPVM